MLKKRNTRRNSKKNNSYQNPQYSVGYNIINNLAEFERLGAAMQSHDQDIAKQIDSEARRQQAEYEKRNAEEIEWERKKEVDRRAFLNRLADYPMPTAFGTMNQLGTFTGSVGVAYNHIKNKDIPNQPKDYGISDLLKDQWNSYFGEMNHLQAEDARGYQVRRLNDIALIKDYNDSLDKLDEIDAINFRLNEINSIEKEGLTKGQVESITKEVQQLSARKKQLQTEYQALAPRRKMLEDTVKQSSLGASLDEVLSGNGIYGGKNPLTALVGTTTALHDEMNDARRFLYDLGSGNRSRTETRMQLKRALDEYDNLNKGWNAIIEENEKAAEKYKNKVTPWFKGREEKASTDFLDPDTYLFKMPGIMGGSASSHMKQVPGLIAGLVAGIVATPLVAGGTLASVLGGVGVAGTGFGTSFTFNRGAGISENNVEVALAAVEKIKERTDLSEKDIKDLLAGKLHDQAKLRQITEQIGNVENLFRTDMAATTWDAAVDAALNTVPLGTLSKLGKFMRGGKAVEKILANQAVKKAVESKIGQTIVNDFRTGYRTFDATSPLGGTIGGALNVTAGRAAREGAKALRNFVVRKADNTLTGALAHDLWKEMEMMGKGLQRLNPEKLEMAARLRNGTRMRYARGIGGRMIKSGVSEGIEEGKQHVNAEAFKNGTLSPEYMDIMDVGLTDMVNGLKMGAYVLGIPLDGLGLIDIKDKQVLAEIKGGMLGGWGHTAAINVVENTIPYVREQRANDIVLQQLYSDKLASQADFKQYTKWLEKGLFKPGYNEVISSFDRMRQINEKNKQTTGEYGIDPSLIDESQKKYSTLMAIAQDPITRKEAENAGINVRSLTNPQSWKSNKEYHEFVAAKAIALEKLNEINKNKKEADDNVRKAEAQNEIQQSIDKENENLEEILDELQSFTEDESGEQYGQTEVNLDDNGRVISIGTKQNKLDKLMTTQLIENRNTAEMVRKAAALAAMLEYRDYVEKALELQKNNPNARVRRGIKDQLDRLNEQIQLYKSINKLFLAVDGQDINTVDDVENLLAFDPEQHDALKEAYLDQLKWEFELDSANRAYRDLVGKHQRIDKDGKAHDLTQDDVDNWDARKDIEHFTTTKGNAKKVLADIHKMEKDDDDFETLIETVYQDDLKAEHLQEENAYAVPEVFPYKYRPVLDANNEQKKAEFDDVGRLITPLANNEFVADDGTVWEDLDFGRKDPVLEAMKSRMSPKEADAYTRRLFAEIFNKNTGTILPMTPEGIEEYRRNQQVKPKTEKAPEEENKGEKGKKGKKEKEKKEPPSFNYSKLVQAYYESRNRLVPPPPAPPITPPTPPGDPGDSSKSPQDETLDMLRNKYETDKKEVLKDPKGYHTTSQDYFVLVNGKPTRMSRMHNVMPESYEHKDRDEFVKGSVESLSEAKSYDDVEEMVVGTLQQMFGEENVPLPRMVDPKTNDRVRIALGIVTDIDKFEHTTNWWQTNAPDMLVYLRYINDNRAIFFENPSPETALELQRTLTNLAKAFYETFQHKSQNSSIRMGNVVDELGRNFFGTDVLYSLTQTPEGIAELFNRINESEGKTYAELFDNNMDAFVDIINQMRERYDYYTNKLGWKLLALPLTWRANFKNTGWVSGETDLIGVDKEGKIHIIDFKTSKNTFEMVHTPNISLTNKYRANLENLTQDDFVGDKLSKNARRVLNDIKQDSGNKKISLQWNPVLGQATIINKSYPFFQKPNVQYGQVISAYNDYSNQQTGYAQMIQLETSGQVASVEIMPFWCNYATDFSKINSIKLQSRHLLTFSKDMLDILSGVSENTNQALQELQTAVNDSHIKLQTLLLDLVNKMDDNVWNTLSDSGKILLGDFISQVNNIDASPTDDMSLLQTVLDEIDNLIEQYGNVLQTLREDYQNQKNLEAQRAEQETRRRQQQAHVQQQESPVQYADNKRDSRGNDSHANLNYKDVQKDEDLELATVSSDFITNADFSLYTEGNRVFVDISYNGKTWKHIEIDTQYYDMRERHAFPIPNGQKLLNQIKELEKIRKAGQRIVPVRATMNRTDGRIKKTTDGSYLSIHNTDLFANEDVYDIEFSFTYGKLGIVDKTGQLVTFDTSDKDRKPIYAWERPEDVPEEGTMMYLKPVRKDEINKTVDIPVALDRVKLTENDANFIINLLKNPNLLDGEYYIQQDGNVYNTRTTGRKLANLMIPIIDNPAHLGNMVSILRNPANPNIVWLIRREDYNAGRVGRGQFDISTDIGVRNLIEMLKTMSIEERHDVLTTRLGTDNTTDLPFNGIRRMFIENNSNQHQLKSVKITDAISFDVEDFKNVVSKTGATRNGLSGFGYYLKHNMLRTQYVRLGHSNVEILEAMLEQDEPVVKANGIPEAPTIANIDQDEVVDDIDAFLLKVLGEDELHNGKRPKKRLSEEKARKHIEKILGDVNVEFRDEFLSALKGTAHVVGCCKADGIILSSYASPRTEYHEAFHRIFETLVPEVTRDKIYKRIAERLGVSLYNEDGTENKQAFREVAEYVADKYMNFMHYRFDDVKIPYLSKWFNKVHDWTNVLLNYSDRDLYKIFMSVNEGQYRNVRPSKRAIARFNKLYGELHATIHGVDFTYIANLAMYDKVRESVLFCLTQGFPVDSSGRNIQEIGKHINKDTLKLGIEKLLEKGYDVIGQNETIPTVGQLAMREIYEKFDMDEIRDDIANDFSVISTDYTKIIEEESNEDAEGDSVTGASIGEHTRSSYEFSRFSKTSSRVRFFFATIPESVYTEVKVVENGKQVIKKIPKLALNEFGLPKYISVGTVFNEVLNLFHDIDTISELRDRLEYLAKEDPMYDIIHRKIFGKKGIYTKTYQVENGKIVRNSDNEALMSQLMNVIRSNRHNFDIARSETRKSQFGSYTIIIQPSGMEYNAKFYPSQWNNMLVNGGTPIIKIDSTGALYFSASPDIFKRIADIFDHLPQQKTAENGAVYTDVGIKQLLNNAFLNEPKNIYLRMNVNGKWGYYNNPNDPGQLQVIKDKIIQALNLVGIQFNIAELNYMLTHKYGSSDASALLRMFNSTNINDSMTSFLGFLRNASQNGKPVTKMHIKGKDVSIKDVYGKLAFIKELANWKYQYRHSHDQLTVLATGNNKFYEISDNNYISDVVRFLNKRTDEFKQLTSGADPYILFKQHIDALNEDQYFGSLILEELSRDGNAFLTVRNFIGFKTDKRNDTGSDYFEISKREDYISKAAILEKGSIIMPTLSDKKTYVYIDGVKLPGLNYENTVDDNGYIIPFGNLGDQFIIPADTNSQLENMLTQDPEVIDRFISYAISEYKAIKKADQDLDQMEKDGTKDSEVDNYYTKEQGAKFSSLLGVWEYDYQKQSDGTMKIIGETYHSFNDNKNKKTRKQNIEEAEKYFFNRSREEQESLIQRILHKRLLKEIETCVELGLIEKAQQYDNIFLNYKNIGLNSAAIEAIYKSLIAKNTDTGILPDVITEDKYKSLATLIYINDISNKAIMSGQEIERVFSGSPAFYKWNFDDEGNLTDRTVDELKRVGGMISTGNNNFLELQDIPQKYLDQDGKFTGEYVCAQVNDEEIASPQIAEIEKQMYYGELSTAVYLKREQEEINKFRQRMKDIERALNNYKEKDKVSEEDANFYNENSGYEYEAEQEIRRQITQEIDNQTEEKLENQLDDATLSIVKRKAKEATDSYRGKINVADGAAYITDTMAEMLLRMNGAYNADIEKAFKILREETPSTILEKQSVYKDIITSVIGSQKYTAFGRRLHNKTGIQIQYYNKMAIFPIFQCMATGRLQNVFNKMKQQGIDMLFMDSAVKVGGQGSKAINWDNYSTKEGDGKPEFSEAFNFDTYNQKFLYLRKQLNTDPREESMMSFGTQARKIAMVNLLDGRTYYMRDGSEITGVDLRNSIMNAINTLSDRGVKHIDRRFFKTDSKGNLLNSDGEIIDKNNPDQKNKNKVLDEQKFSNEVRKLMMTKDPDKNILDAIEIVERVDEDGVKRKHMRLPLDAISNARWLESVLISAINKKVVDVNTTGDAFIQRSIWAMEGGTMLERKNGQIIGDDQLPKSINGGNRLQMINEEGSMDCVVSVDMIKKMFNGDLPRVPIKDKNRNVIWDKVPLLDERGEAKKDKDGNIIYAQKRDEKGNLMFDAKGNPVYKRRIRTREMTFDELRSWLINRGIIGKDAKACIIAYRIPTQAQSSIHALRIVDIVPVVNDTVILPAEFTKITGSDFDIDKLFMSTIQYKVQRKEGEDGKYHQTVTSSFEEHEDTYYQNKLIESYITLALDWKSHNDHTPRTTNILHRSIDNDTELLKNVVRDIEKDKKQEVEEPYEFYSLSSQTAAKDDYITGKVGIGPFALNNNNHLLTMMYHVRFKHIESSLMSELGLESLDNHQDIDGESIMSWLSALINAHVDIARDPYIGRLNVNPFTYNLVNLLVRTGFGKKTFYFTSQPIMKELAKVYANAGAIYMSDPHSSKYNLQKEAIENTAKEWFKGLTVLGKPAEQLIAAIQTGGKDYAKLRSEINAEIRKLFDTSLMNDAKSNDVDLNHQLLYYLAYLQFDNYANALSSLVKYSKIDTKKHGKSVVEQIVYRNGFQKTYDVTRESNLFDPVGLTHMLEDSYIQNQTNNALNCVSDIFASQFIQSTPAFLNSVDMILNAIGRTESLSASLVEKISNALSAAIKSKFFVEEYIPTFTSDPDYIRNLITGENTIYDRFARLQIAIQTDPRYRDLLSSSGEMQNKLLQMLVPGNTSEYYNSYIPGEVVDTYPNLKFVKFFNFVEDGGNTANYIIEAWDELLNYTNEDKDAQNTIREFARDLIVYGFITSGDRGGFTKIFKYVPASWREQSGYGNFLRRKALEYQIMDKTDIDIDDVILNNWFDNELVRTYREKDEENHPNFMNYYTKINGVACGFPTVKAAIKKDGNKYVASIDPNNAPKYIKVKRRKDRFSYDSQRRFTIYKLHRIALSNDGVEYPVYVKVNPKGNQVTGNFLVTEYGRSDARWEEYSINEDVLKQIYTAANIGQYIDMFKYTEANYSSIIAGLNRAWNRDQEKAVEDYTGLSDEGGFFDNNTMQNIYQNWKYMEESGNSTPNTDVKSVKHIAKSILGVEMNESMGARMYDFVKELDKNWDVDTKVTVPYAEYKEMSSKISRFDDIRGMFIEEFGLDNDVVYGKYNKSNKTITFDKNVYEIYKSISQNQDLLDFVNNVLNKANMFHYIATDEDSLLYLLENGMDAFDGNIETRTENYSQLDIFQDTAQQDMNDDSEFSDEAMKYCKS